MQPPITFTHYSFIDLRTTLKILTLNFFSQIDGCCWYQYLSFKTGSLVPPCWILLRRKCIWQTSLPWHLVKCLGTFQSKYPGCLVKGDKYVGLQETQQQINPKQLQPKSYILESALADVYRVDKMKETPLSRYTRSIRHCNINNMTNYSFQNELLLSCICPVSAIFS